MKRSLLALSLLYLAACQTGTLGESAITATCTGKSARIDMSADTGEDVLSRAYWCDVEENGLTLYLENVNANCCPSPEASTSVSGSVISVDIDSETSNESCDCICNTNFEIKLDSPGEGSWTVDITYDGDHLGTALCD